MGMMIDETNLMNLLYALDDARHDLCYAIKKISELPTVEAIPKDQYEARLNADMVNMLTELKAEFDEGKIDEKHLQHLHYYDLENAESYNNGIDNCIDTIQVRIDKLKGEDKAGKL
jgi:membrane-bound lytic murein transglycosylase MltF